ncbi:MAG TPA: FAD-binding oxidoreductase [Solirubrobacteraceae bacterium]|nr:FAD-binding oxidoreductase [Solirubrobacteraceae bacterium]
MVAESPTTYEAAAELLRSSAERRLRVRMRGGATKLSWGGAVADPDVELSTGGLDRIVEHNAGDLTAVLQAGLPIATAQRVFAEAGQRLSLDPPSGDGATVGGLVSSGDSGPLRHRYGAPRDLVIGVTAALGEGTVARAGGKVIKNVAGYDLAKLFSGSLGTLGAIVEVAVRLHPLPPATATLTARSDDPSSLAAAAARLAHASLELEALDVAWEEGSGTVLAGFGGATAAEQATAAGRLLFGSGTEAGVVTDDAPLWQRQRDRQRSPDGIALRISAVPSALEDVLRAADDVGGALVGRAALGLHWLTLAAADPAAAAATVARLRSSLAPAPCVVLDAPPAVREAVDVWGPIDEPTLALMRRVKRRFDPRAVCNPGCFVGGI